MREESGVWRTEWSETDERGGASTTASGVRTRREQGLLWAAAFGRRFLLVNGFDAWIDVGGERRAITSQRYAPDVLSPDGARRIVSFRAEPWPRWTFDLGGELRGTQECLLRPGTPIILVTWRLSAPRRGATLELRPLLSGRETVALHEENEDFAFEPEKLDALLSWRPYDGVPGFIVSTNATYAHDPVWYRRFVYEEEEDAPDGNQEDLASPGVFRFDVGATEACWLLGVDTPEVRHLLGSASPSALASLFRLEEQRRRRSA